jgi:hypothetical protein
MESPTPTPASRTKSRSLIPALTALSLTLVSLASSAAATFQARLREARRDESGNVITDNLGWIVFGVIAIVAIGALIKALGATVIHWVSTQLGL